MQKQRHAGFGKCWVNGIQRRIVERVVLGRAERDHDLYERLVLHAIELGDAVFGVGKRQGEHHPKPRAVLARCRESVVVVAPGQLDVGVAPLDAVLAQLRE